MEREEIEYNWLCRSCQKQVVPSKWPDDPK